MIVAKISMKMRPKLASENEALALESFCLLKLGMQMSICSRNQLVSKKKVPQILVIHPMAPLGASVSLFVRSGGKGQASQLLRFLPT